MQAHKIGGFVQLTRVATAAVLSLGLAACGGGGSSSSPTLAGGTGIVGVTTPTPVPTATALGYVPADFTSGTLNQGCPTGVLATDTTTYLFAHGRFADGTFTQSTTPRVGWERVSYVLATPNPSPTPTVMPTPATAYVTDFVYSGNYSILNGQSGCFAVFGHIDGSDFPSLPGINAIANSSHEVPAGYALNVVNSGQMSAINLGNLFGASGSGTFKLDNGQTGTITITNYGTATDPISNSPQSYERSIQDDVKALPSEGN